MKLNFLQLLQFIFPLSEDEQRIALCAEATFVSKLHRQQIGDILALSSFNDTHIRAAIHLAKFHNNKKAVMLLGALLHAWLQILSSHDAIIIPAPLSAQRLRERGYNQVCAIAKAGLVGIPNIVIQEDILIKQRHTQPQVSLSKKDRTQNLHGAFTLNEKKAHLLAEKRIILLDDVVTTGSTLKEAKAALLHAHPQSIICVAVAH